MAEHKTKSKHHKAFAHNHGAHMSSGHHGLVKTSAKHGGGKGGNLMVSASNVKALGSKGKG